MNYYIIRIYRYADTDIEHAYPIADILMSGPIFGSDKKFAQKHGGDFIEFLSLQVVENDSYIYSR